MKTNVFEHEQQYSNFAKTELNEVQINCKLPTNWGDNIPTEPKKIDKTAEIERLKMLIKWYESAKNLLDTIDKIKLNKLKKELNELQTKVN